MTLTLLAELWFEERPALDRGRLMEWLPDAELAPADQLLVIHPRFVRQAPDDAPAVIMTGVLQSGEQRSHEHEPTTAQTWDWDEADAVLARCAHSVLLAELVGRSHPYAQRAAAFRDTLRAAVRAWGPAAVWCANSERVVAPARVLEDDLAALVNVRMFRMQDALVMDTLGLHALALPDVECRFRPGDPGVVAARLYAAARTLLQDGEPAGEPRSPALAEPARGVLELPA